MMDRKVEETPCLIFAYSEMGAACIETLLELGAPISAVITHRDDPHENVWWRSCAELAGKHSIPVYVPKRIDAAWTGRLAEFAPAIIYSFYYRNLLADEVLRLAPLGAYNLHPSLLPLYRGRAPVNWMLANGEHLAGVTLHHMVARADAGDIVAQRKLEIGDDDTALSLHRRLVPLGASLVREFHPLIVARRAPRFPQDLAKGSYYGRRRPDDGKIDWNWPARRIYNLVRAVTHPYPGAFCFTAGRKLFIWEARLARESGKLGTPGEIVGARSDGAAEFAAGDGSLLVTRIQFEGGPEGNPAEVLGAANDLNKPSARFE